MASRREKKPASGAPILKNAPINLEALRTKAQSDFFSIIEGIGTKVVLAIDPSLVRVLDLVCDVSEMQKHGAEKILITKNEPLLVEGKQILYITRPDLAAMRTIAEQIKYNDNNGFQKNYWIYFVPRRMLLCEQYLSEEGVLDDNVTLGEFHLDLVALDPDLISLEMGAEYYRALTLSGDRTILHHVARSVMRLQSVFGLIPTISGVGKHAERVAAILARMRKEMPEDDVLEECAIDEVIFFDRDVDMITPMLTPLTYEGLVDAQLQIDTSYIEVDETIHGDDKKKGKKKFALNANDRVYSELRNLNIVVLGPTLNRRACELDESYRAFRDGAHTISQVNSFARNLEGFKADLDSVRMHTNIAECISTVTKSADFRARIEAEQNCLSGGDAPLAFIEESIYRNEPLAKVLRLVALLSVCSDGLKPKILDSIRRDILQTYGYDTLMALANLERLNLLTPFRPKTSSSPKGSWTPLRRAFHLIIEEISVDPPTDPAYVFSGFCPLAVRLLMGAENPGWDGMGEQLGLLAHPVFRRQQATTGGPSRHSNRPDGRRLVVVYFIGGITFSEISAIRFLNERPSASCLYLIATTKVTSGETWLNSMLDF